MDRRKNTLIPIAGLPEGFYVETVPLETEESGFQDMGAVNNVAHQVEDAFTRAQDAIVVIASDLASKIKALDSSLTPDEFALEFSISFGVEGQIILASTSTEANLKVKMVYKHTK